MSETEDQIRCARSLSALVEKSSLFLQKHPDQTLISKHNALFSVLSQQHDGLLTPDVNLASDTVARVSSDRTCLL